MVDLEPAGGQISERLGHQRASQAGQGGVGDGERTGAHRLERGSDAVGDGAGPELVKEIIEETARALSSSRLEGLDSAASADQVEWHP